MLREEPVRSFSILAARRHRETIERGALVAISQQAIDLSRDKLSIRPEFVLPPGSGSTAWNLPLDGLSMWASGLQVGFKHR